MDDTEQKASPSDADGTKTDKNWKEVKVRWVLDETFSEKDTYDGETPGTYVFDAELKSSRYELDTGFLPSIEVTVLPEEKGPAIIGFSELDETVAVQKLPLGAKESDIILPDILEVEVEEADETLAEDSQNVHLVKAVDKGTEKDTDAETAVWQISGITWKLDEEQSDLPEFHGGISEKDYFEEFDEDGEPVETSTKTWAGYEEANQDYNGCAYVYTPVLPEEYPMGEEAELPEICVLVGEMQLMTLAGEEYDLNNEPLLINSANKNEFNGKTITGRYCPTNRPEATYTDIKGGIIIDNVTVDLTIKNVTIQSGGARGWNLAGIYLKGNAQLNLTLEGTNTLVGLDEGAGIEVGKGATLVITENSTGSLKAVGGAYGAAGIGGKGTASDEGADNNCRTGTIIIKGGTIEAEGGAYWVSYSRDYHGGAGIGTGRYGIGGTIKILGGTITAKGGRQTGAGIGGGMGGSVDTIVIDGRKDEAPNIAVSFYKNEKSEYLGAAIGSGWNGVTDLKLSCGDIQILSGSVKVTGGNIGYGELWPLDGNGMEGGSVTISEEVQLELPLESKIAPRGEECTYGKKTFQITAYDNQLQNETYQADIALYWKNDTERKNPVYEKSTQMTVSGFRGTIPDITQWMGYSGNMQMVVALEPSGGGTVKTMEGSVVLNKGKDETISVTLGKAAYQKAMDLTIHDGRLRDDKNYTLTVQIGEEASEGGAAPDVVTYLSQKASGYQIKTGKVSWYTPLSGEIPVSVQVQEEGENTNSFTVTGSLSMKSEKETNLSLTIGESLYPVRFHFYSSKVQAAENVSLTAERLAGAASEASVDLKQDKGQFAFDGKLTIDEAAGNHAYALAYLPAGNYRFLINTGIRELGSSGGRFTIDSGTVKAEDAGTDIIILNDAEALEGELDLSLGNISFSEENGQLAISYSKTDDSGKVVTARLIDQSYDKCYRITSSGKVENYHLSVNTPASEELKLVLRNLTITPAEAIAPIQINGASHVTTYLEGENKILINKSGKSSSSPAGISVAKGAKLTIDSEPEQQGSIEVLNNTKVSKTGAAIGGNVGQDTGIIHIKGGTVIAKMTDYNPRGAAIGASAGKSVEEIRISGGVVTAKGSWGAGIGTGSADSQERTGKIVIEGGTVNASSENGAGIGSGIGYARSKPAITAEIEIHGGMITAYSERGACIGSGLDSSSKVLIDGGTICLDKKTTGYRKVAHIGMGESSNTQVQTDVTITGGTICLKEADGYIPRPIIYGWEQVGKTWQKNNTIKDGNGTPVYYTTADLTGIYDNNTLVGDASIEESSYGFQDVRTDSSGKLYMYLPASEAVKASFGGVEFTGKVEAGKDENVLEREQTSIDYQREVLKNTALYELEYAESENSATWTKIPAGGEASLTKILDNQPENAREITLYVRKAAAGSTAGEAAAITIPVRPAKPDPIQITNVTKDSYLIKAGTAVSGCEYGISESVDGELQWQSGTWFKNRKPANTYYITLRVKATDNSFASKSADRLSVTTPDILRFQGPAGDVSFEANGTYGQTLSEIPVQLAEGFRVVNSRGTEVSGEWSFSKEQKGTQASSIYPEVKGTTAYQVEFSPEGASEGQYGNSLKRSVIPEISPKELTAVVTTPIEKPYDENTDIALAATVAIGTPGQNYTISGLKGRFEDANAGIDKTVTIDSSEAKVETGESAVNLQNYRIIYPAQTGTIHQIQGSVSIDSQAWTGEKTYGDDSFSLTGVNVEGDGALNYTSSDEKVLTVDAQGQVTIKGTGSAKVSITMEDGKNYIGTNTPADGTITIKKGTLALTLTAVNRTTGVQLSKGILGTEEEDFDIIARVQGVYQDKLQGYVHFYDNENPDADIVSVGEDGTAVLKWTKPGESFVGTHTIKAEFDCGEFNTWESRYNTPAPASLTFEISKAAPPAEDKPEDSDKPDNSDKPDQSGSQSSSSGRDKSSGSGATRRDPVRGRTNSITGILTGTANSTANDGKSHWMQDEHGWWLRFADSSYPKAEKRGTNGIAYAWEQVNGNWWAFDESGYIKTGWMRDEDYGGWFYLDPEHGMQTGWVLIDGKWHYFHPTSDGRKGILYVGRLTPDGYYVDENGVWDGKDRQ
ncbi:YDG domain-containing protein [Clostridium fessum]|uniref:YDG domain-containing protein n=1 Tax=Clostridium fessum TaxID=2126740 RepID=UPI0022E1F6A8|nr:YDG domain-containing protein [Clostridium fessum]